MKNVIKFSVVILLIFVIQSCKKESPTIITAEITNITATSALSGGNLTRIGDYDIIWKGVCWSTNENPTNSTNSQTRENNSARIFTSNITELSPNTTYYVRAFVLYNVHIGFMKDETHTVFGNQVTFKTLSVVQK